MPNPSATKACTEAQTPFARVISVAWIARAPAISPRAGEARIEALELAVDRA